ncbi:hypothetical protein HAX54_044605, partial [Datura stramonium]|nr:hypothetical protein [Datura stramonium]
SKAKENLNDSAKSCNHDFQNGSLKECTARERVIVGNNTSYYVSVGSSGSYRRSTFSRSFNDYSERVIVIFNDLYIWSSIMNPQSANWFFVLSLTTASHRYNDVTKSLVRTTTTKYKAQEAFAATTSPRQSDEGGYEAESYCNNPPADNAGKGNDDVAQSGEGDTNAEESRDKDSGAEESNK